jgi:hypothetical protein
MQDKWTALAHGRPSHITDDDWMVSDLDITDFESRSSGDDSEIRVDNQSGAAEIVQMVYLTRILSEIMRKFYTLRGSCNQDTSYLYSQAIPLLGMLDTWRSSLPTSLHMDYQIVSRLCSNGLSKLSQKS